MPQSLSGLSTRRTPTRDLVVELTDATIILKLVLGLLLTGIAWAWLSSKFPIASLLSWKSSGILIALVVLAVGSSLWLRSRSRLRITIDRTRSIIAVDTRNNHFEHRLADVVNVEFKRENSMDGEDTYYKLELVLRSEKRVPVDTDVIVGYQAGARNSFVKIINQELGDHHRSGLKGRLE